MDNGELKNIFTVNDSNTNKLAENTSENSAHEKLSENRNIITNGLLIQFLFAINY